MFSARELKINTVARGLPSLSFKGFAPPAELSLERYRYVLAASAARALRNPLVFLPIFFPQHFKLSMATEEHKELPGANCSQLENAETGIYDDATVTINSTMCEKKAAAFMILLNGDDKANEGVKNKEVKNNKDEEVYSVSNKGTISVTGEIMTSSMPAFVEDNPHDNVNTAVASTISERTGDASITMVGEQNKEKGMGKKDNVEKDKNVEVVISSSNEKKKRIVKKRKKVEEAPADDISTPPKMMKKKMNDVKKEVRMEEKLEKLVLEKGDKKDVKVVKKGEEAANKTDCIVKKKIAAKAKVVRPNTESVPSKSESTVTAASTLKKEEKRNQSIEVDENIESVARNVKVVKKVEGAANKTIKKVKNKIVSKGKGGSPLTPAKSPNVETLAPNLWKEENKKQNIKVDECLAFASTSNIPATVNMHVEGKEDNSNDAEKVEVAFESKGKKNAAISSTSSTNANKLYDAEKPIPSVTEIPLKRADTAEKLLKKLDGMGLIFMCNAKTKKDCYRFNVFGLPASKKELVAKVYKGMRLFLFDVDLKLMYGIYQAASTGGYNIEPKAFDSKYPSQARFTVLTDCLPLPEEKFKAAIKENYYRRNKFNCQLSLEQVKNLCKLFRSATSKASETKHRAAVDREATIPTFSTRERVRRLLRDAERGQPTNGDIYTREAYALLPRAHYPSRPPRTLPPASLSRVLPPPPRSAYAYELPVDDHYSRDRELLDLEMWHRDPSIDFQDHYRQSALQRVQVHPPRLPPAYAARLLQAGSPPKYRYQV